ncbi:MgtC/SapB family protein [Chryseobacterium koreense]|uniref:MgtC/SapB family protein n=1 Tax=Chryseobacterium koreense TaxID=232216 RepID=UPI0026E9B179|nr:MgtC/SapB family protein [Chryseobacterium koreense]
MMTYFQDLFALFNYRDLLLVLVAIAVGMAIGMEREYHNKTAGLRTIMLVCVGSCIFTILSMRIGAENPDRIAANIITGIGFLGAGVIFKDENKVNGLTTACTIWVTAALGMAVGSQHIFLAIFGAAVVLLVLWGLLYLEKWIDHLNKITEYKITTIFKEGEMEEFKKLFKENHLKSSIIFQSKSADRLTIYWKLSGRKRNHKILKKQLFSNADILKIDIV